MSDKKTAVLTEVAAAPAMKIVFQRPLSPVDGHGISFEFFEDVTLERAYLDELLDKMSGASERLMLIDELPRLKQLRLVKIEMLKEQRKARAEAQARIEAHVFKFSHDRQGNPRRQAAEPPPADMNAIAQYDKRIADLTQELKTIEHRIPYAEAVIAGRTPPDEFPELQEAAD